MEFDSAHCHPEPTFTASAGMLAHTLGASVAEVETIARAAADALDL